MAENQNRTVRPWRFPIFRLLGIGLALGCSYLTMKTWEWTRSPLEEFYFSKYASLSLTPNLSHVHFAINRGLPEMTAFEVAFVGNSVATTANVPRLRGRFHAQSFQMEPGAFYRWLKENIYAGKSLGQLIRIPLYTSESLLGLLFFLGSYFDYRQRRKARNGRIIRGPGLISRFRFNLKTRGDGLAFPLSNWRNLFELLMPGDSGKYLRLEREKEPLHIQISGDTGSGKSTLIRQILYQVEERGDEVAIVFDPGREYIQEFFREERGDWVLNPKDERCPYWPIGEEATDEADATPVANGFFPEGPTRQQFFLSHTRAIFAYLLARYKPTVNELAYWMAHPEQIDQRVKGTEHEHTLTVNAAPQRAGILGSLNEAGKPLRMMPSHSEGRRIWTAKSWAEKRKGWIFITSTPETLDALRPIQSLWLDMLILKLQTSEPKSGQPRVWMVLDELASLNALPQLHSALTKQRKSGNPIVIGFQSMSDVDAIYPKQSETILSQSYSNFVLRVRDPRGAKHLSELIGKAQLDRVRENVPAQLLMGSKQGSYNTERVVDSVVMESQIQGLKNLNGYFVQEDKVVRIRFKYRPKRVIAPAVIERTIPTAELRPLDPEAPLPKTTTTSEPATTESEKPARNRRPKKAKDSVLPQNSIDTGMGLFS